MSSSLKSFLTTAAMFSGCIALISFISLLPVRLGFAMVQEGGVIETLSVAGYFQFCLLFIYLRVLGIHTADFAPCIFVFLLGLRELDYHSRFTTMGMFKSRFFISSEVPLGEKVVVVIFIVLLLVYGGRYLRKAYPSFKNGVTKLRPYAVSVVCGILCAVISKSIDSNNEIFEKMLVFASEPQLVSKVTEECVELFIPIFFIRAIIEYCSAMAVERSS